MGVPPIKWLVWLLISLYGQDGVEDGKANESFSQYLSSERVGHTNLFSLVWIGLDMD